MMKPCARILSLVIALITAVSIGVAAAHGDGKHVFGTITALGPTQIEVLTVEGTTVSVQTFAETKYRNRRSGDDAEVPTVGDRVAVDVREEDGKLIATEVQFSSSAKKHPQ